MIAWGYFIPDITETPSSSYNKIKNIWNVQIKAIFNTPRTIQFDVPVEIRLFIKPMFTKRTSELFFLIMDILFMLIVMNLLLKIP